MKKFRLEGGGGIGTARKRVYLFAASRRNRRKSFYLGPEGAKRSWRSAAMRGYPGGAKNTPEGAKIFAVHRSLTVSTRCV